MLGVLSSSSEPGTSLVMVGMFMVALCGASSSSRIRYHTGWYRGGWGGRFILIEDGQVGVKGSWVEVAYMFPASLVTVT